MTQLSLSYCAIFIRSYYFCFMSIEVKNLLKVYGEQKAVNNISFKVDKGEIVGFLGPNGAGKSTTMKIITGYLQQDSGEAFVSNVSVTKEPLTTKKKIGYLPEANALYYDMYVKEYLGFISEVHKIENKKAKIESVIQPANGFGHGRELVAILLVVAASAGAAQGAHTPPRDA